MLMHDINRLERRLVFPVKTLTVLFSLGLLFYLTVLFAPETLIGLGPEFSEARLVLLLNVGLALPPALIVMLILVLRRANSKLGITSSFRDSLLVVGLSLMVMLSFVLVQQRVDILISRGTQAP